MATQTELMAAGCPAGLAKLIGQVTATGLSAAGTTQGTATAITGNSAFSTVASLSGAVLPSATGSPIITVYNGGVNTLTVYPASGESFYGQSANAGVPCVTGKSVTFTPTAVAWMVNFSA